MKRLLALLPKAGDAVEMGGLEARTAIRITGSICLFAIRMGDI